MTTPLPPYPFKLHGTPIAHDVAGQMEADLRRRARECTAAQAALKAALKTVEAFERHREQVRGHLLEAIGGLPGKKSPLNPRVTGVVEEQGLSIEKLLFESLPRYWVSALCYLPREREAKAPAVLFLCGHSDNGKAYARYQRVCRDLAANGFIVLAIDPIGQGERFQYLREGRSVHYSNTVEHSYAGLPFLLQGANVARHFVWDAMRGIDWLIERGDVDPDRIAATGNSGGGTQTALLMALEPRLRAAVPCTWITSQEAMMQTGHPQDMEQIIYGAMSRGPDHDDYLAAMAPRPALVGAAAYDPFPLEGTLASHERARAVYALYGMEEKAGLAVDAAPHEYTPGLREACVNWLRQHLRNRPGDFVTTDSPVLEDADLQVTQSGQVVIDFPESRTIFDLNCELLAAQPPRPARSPARLRTELAETLGVSTAGNRGAAIHPRIHRREHGGYVVEETFFFSAPGMAVCGPLFLPHHPSRATVLMVLDRGTADLPENMALVEPLLREGKAVFVFDPRGLGGVRARSVSASEAYRTDGDLDAFAQEYPFFTTGYKMACDAMMLGMSTLGLRVFDLLRAFDYLHPRGPVELYGTGRGAIWAYFAAVLEERIAAVTCADMLMSYRDLCRTRFYDASRFNLDITAWGLLRCGDLEDFRPCIEPRPLSFIRPRNARNQILP
ncbi:MAG TPA: acetylxylan esterase [Chthoniobacteraceae bacterium]|nr:acetylxylan esterase [Chthoniobacteraceae bacterium]